MGRWEQTKKIQPFKGVYLLGEARATNDEKERLRQLDQAKRRDALKNNGELCTLAKKQNIDDDYGVPQTQAQVEVESTAEIISDIEAEDAKLIDQLRDKERLIAYLKEEGYSSESEFERAVVINSQNNTSTMTMKQLTKLADKLGVHYYELSNHDILFADDVFQHAVAVATGVIDQSGQKEPVAEKRRLITDIYHNNLRDPLTIGAYDDMKAMITAYYDLDETRNSNGTPVGKYGRYMHYYDAVYDEFRRMDIYPDFWQVTEGMTVMITEASRQRRERTRETRRKRNEVRAQIRREWIREGLTPAQMDSASFIEFRTPI